MKVIEKDDKKKKEEQTANAYLLSLQENKNFQKYFIQGIVLPQLEKLTSLAFLYERKEFVSADDAEIASIIRQNRNTYIALKSMMAPVLQEEDREL